MGMVDERSLAVTLDRVSDAFFRAAKPSPTERRQAASWIASRQGLPGSYADMFAPTPVDFGQPLRFFTGEALTTRVGKMHVLGEEACRALILLNVNTAGVRDALTRASAGMLERLRASEARERQAGRAWRGEYCCGKCTVAMWRQLGVGGLEHAEWHLAAGVKSLRQCRLGNGRWRRFPYYYTLLALSDVDLPGVVDELRYAAPILERFLKRTRSEDRFGERRRLLAERVLARC